MDNVVIKSVNSSATLTFSDRIDDYFTVSYVSPEISFSKKVWGYTDCEFLVGLFSYIAKEWQGWKGEQEWESIESDFSLSATCDNLGHITLMVKLRKYSESEEWDASANLVIEPAQTDIISKRVEQFFAD